MVRLLSNFFAQFTIANFLFSTGTKFDQLNLKERKDTVATFSLAYREESQYVFI